MTPGSRSANESMNISGPTRAECDRLDDVLAAHAQVQGPEIRGTEEVQRGQPDRECLHHRITRALLSRPLGHRADPAPFRDILVEAARSAGASIVSARPVRFARAQERRAGTDAAMTDRAVR